MFNHKPNLRLSDTAPCIKPITQHVVLLANHTTTTQLTLDALFSALCRDPKGAKLAYLYASDTLLSVIPYIVANRRAYVLTSLAHLNLSNQERWRQLRAVYQGVNTLTGLPVLSLAHSEYYADATAVDYGITVWVDSDGVLMDWQTKCLELMGSLGHHFPSIKEFNTSNHRVPLSKEMYQTYPDMFLNLAPTTFGIGMMDRIMATCEGKASVKVLTAIGGEHHDVGGARLDKTYSLINAYPLSTEDIHVVMSSRDKVDYMQPGDIIIDDWLPTIDAANQNNRYGIQIFDTESSIGGLKELHELVNH